MELERDIPFDTPENTVKNIIQILQEEATRAGATFDCREERQEISIKVDIYSTLHPRKFHLLLQYVEYDNLGTILSSIGNGFIFADPVEWDLQLHSRTWTDYSAPFQWWLYPRDADYLHIPPSHVLDGTLLRRLLRDSLSPPPSSAP